MARPQTEFHDTESIPWQHAEGYPEGVSEKILSKDPETGNCTKLFKFEPGTWDSLGREPKSHDFYEEVYILKGGLIDPARNLTVTEGCYCYRHPGMKHGPFSAPTGAIALIIATYL